MPVAAPAPPKDYRGEFPIFRRTIYLNSCSLGALSTRSRTRVNEYLDLWEGLGAAAWYEIWWGALAELRSRYGRLIGAADGSIALHPNISSALTAVAESLDYRRRPKIVVTSLDFPTISYQWLARAHEVPHKLTQPARLVAPSAPGFPCRPRPHAARCPRCSSPS